MSGCFCNSMPGVWSYSGPAHAGHLPSLLGLVKTAHKPLSAKTMHAQIDRVMTTQLSMLLGKGQGRGIGGTNPYNAAIVALSPFHLAVIRC